LFYGVPNIIFTSFGDEDKSLFINDIHKQLVRLTAASVYFIVGVIYDSMT
jgi:hypothetical protein